MFVGRQMIDTSVAIVVGEDNRCKYVVEASSSVDIDRPLECLGVDVNSQFVVRSTIAADFAFPLQEELDQFVPNGQEDQFAGQEYTAVAVGNCVERNRTGQGNRR